MKSSTTILLPLIVQATARLRLDFIPQPAGAPCLRCDFRRRHRTRASKQPTQRENMNTKIDIKSTVLGAFLGAVIVFSVAAATTSSTTTKWDYKVVVGPIGNKVSGYSGALEPQIVQAAADGWEVSHVGVDVSSGPFAVLRKPKN